MLAAPGAALRAPSQDTGSRVVFLEHYLLANGSVTEGTARFRSVNFPTYWFNENTRQLNGEVDFPVNESLVMVFGDILTLRGNFGAGTGNRLFGAYSLPVIASQAVIHSIDPTGSVIMSIGQKTLALGPGQSYSYEEEETLKEQDALIRVRYNHTYVNHGLIDKKGIVGSLVSAP